MEGIAQNLSERKAWIDVSKGIAIILMVLGHTSIPRVLSDFVWSFHMPLFFICSGICTKWDINFCEFILRKSKSLLLPFIIYSVCVLIVMGSTIGCDINDFLYNGWQGYALWFIPVLYTAIIIAYFVIKIKNPFLKFFSFFLIAIVGALFSYNKIQLPWTLSSVPYSVFLIAIGSIFKSMVNIIEKPRIWILIICFMLTFLISRVWRLDLAWNNITPILPLTIGACAGTLFVFTLSSYIDFYLLRISKALQSIGKETYIILAFSQITILLLNNYYHLNMFVKYIILIIILVVIKYTKELINKLLSYKVL